MITLPYRYPDYFGNAYFIVGALDWGNLLVKNPSGHVNVVPNERVDGLLKSIGIQAKDIPGYRLKFQWEEECEPS